MKPVLKFVCLSLCTCDKDQLMLQTSVHVCNKWILQCAAWSIIDSTKFMRGMDRNCQIREICTSAYMLSNSIQPFVHQPANDFQTCKPNHTMTSEWAVSFMWNVAWHVNIVIAMVGEPGEYYLRHFSTEDGKGSSIIDGIYSVIKGTDLKENVAVVGYYVQMVLLRWLVIIKAV